MQPQPGLIFGGKFRLERPLSRGAMGAIWAARHVQLGAPVAIKFMDPVFAASSSFRARFAREARAAAALKSPHVVHVQDYGIENGTPYLVMELLQGEDLEERLERCGRISLNEMWRILVQVGKGLRRAHGAGFVHRDLKPGNLFLARGVEDDEEEVVKILDFGIAKEAGSQRVWEATKTGQILGSPYYMSPEQIRGDKDIDIRSDLWSLGVIIFRALTGQLPFYGNQLGAIMSKILVDPIPSVTQIAPDLPPALDAFFARALARDRGQRFPSVREMVDEFTRVAGVRRFAPSLPDSYAAPHAPPDSHSFQAAHAVEPARGDTPGAARAPLPNAVWGLTLAAAVILGLGAALVVWRLLVVPSNEPAPASPAPSAPPLGTSSPAEPPPAP